MTLSKEKELRRKFKEAIPIFAEHFYKFGKVGSKSVPLYNGLEIAMMQPLQGDNNEFYLQIDMGTAKSVKIKTDIQQVDINKVEPSLTSAMNEFYVNFMSMLDILE